MPEAPVVKPGPNKGSVIISTTGTQTRWRYGRGDIWQLIDTDDTDKWSIELLDVGTRIEAQCRNISGQDVPYYGPWSASGIGGAAEADIEGEGE